MARRRLKPPLSLSLLGLFLAILASLYLMSTATQNASHLGPMYSGLLLINTLASVVLLGLVGANVYSLSRQIRKRKAGSSLTARMVILFTLLTLAPASVVFYFSMQFIQQSIDSWFDVRIDQAMEDALKLGQAALDERMRAVLKETGELALHLRDIPESLLAVRLDELRDSSQDGDLTVFSKQGRIVALSGGQSGSIIPDLPEIGILLQVRQGKSYVGLEPYATNRRQIRVLVAMGGDDSLYLQAIYAVPVRLTQLAETVEAAYLHYREMTFLRRSLKFTFSLTLSLVLLLSLLAAIWAAFLSIRRIVAPVRHLAQGTRAVAAGHYEKRLRVKSRDELGFLVESFNTMTERIAQARDEAHLSRQQVERQRSYLETILANLSSAVLSLDAHRRILTVNQAADVILHIRHEACVGLTVESLGETYPHLAELMRRLAWLLTRETAVWQEEMPYTGPRGRQELFCRGTSLLDAEGVWQGAVVVFDDVTALIQAQRDAAWSEVARRLAHEIKNPLTPIQLSAERLQHKLAKNLEPADADMLERATRTIVQQVEAMKFMVNAFAEYAKPSVTQPQNIDMTGLIEQVVALYPPPSGLEFVLAMEPGLPCIAGDPVKLRQVLHNLIKNAQEAMQTGTPGLITITAALRDDNRRHWLEIYLQDNGPGISREHLDRIFEPYVTSKTRGTGLGLAIVKKIIEEHGGTIQVDAQTATGAGFRIRLPVIPAA